MKLSAKHEIMEEINADILILGVFQKDDTLSKFAQKIDKKTGGLISDFVLKKEGFEGKFLDTYQLNNFQSGFGINKILIAGLGKKEEFSLDKLRELSAKIYKQCDSMANPKTVYCEILASQHFESKYIPCANAIAEGVLVGSYDFNKYKSKKTPSKIVNFVLLAENEVKQTITNKIIKRAVIVNNSLSFAKDLINEPAGVVTPAKIAQYAKEIANEHSLEINVYDRAECEKMGMSAFLAVGQGSDEPLKFIHLKYSPDEPKKSIALVGKGLTFDSGGLDIKPAASMLDMKDDMSGCACVLGAIKALAQLKVNVEVHAISAICENMPSGRAYKPGDILTAKNGKTIEVDNTDAEGRLTLADALTYADELKVDEIIDVATLTGACIIALGQKVAGIMGTEQQMVNKLVEVAKKSGERLWQLPLYEDLQDNLKSEIADMRNTGGKEAGTSTAGKFLSNFVKNKNWAHIDIAGTAFISKAYRELSKGPTGSMVKTLINYVCEIGSAKD